MTTRVEHIFAAKLRGALDETPISNDLKQLYKPLILPQIRKVCCVQDYADPDRVTGSKSC